MGLPPGCKRRGVQGEDHLVAVVGVVLLADLAADHELGVEALLQLALQGLFVFFSGFDLAAGELPLQLQHCRLTALRDQVFSVALDDGSHNSNNLFCHNYQGSSLEVQTNLSQMYQRPGRDARSRPDLGARR